MSLGPSVAKLILGAGAAVLVLWAVVLVSLRRARRRPSLDKYADIPPVEVIPNRRAS